MTEIQRGGHHQPRVDATPEHISLGGNIGDLHDNVYAELAIRNRGGMAGALDMKAGAMAFLAMSTIGETMQTELQRAREAFSRASSGDWGAVKDIYVNDGLMSQVAQIPLDNKGIGLAAATYALVSGARRYWRYESRERDIDKEIARVTQAESIDLSKARGFRVRRRIAGAALSAVAVFGGYQAGEHMSQVEVLGTGMSMVTLAAGSSVAAEIRANRYRKRNRNNFLRIED